MFSAFTGTPAAGKTLNLLEYVDTDPQYKGREVYYYGINECRMDGWTELTEEQLYTWYEYLPDGCVLVVDEAQEHWRAGTPTAKIPLHLTKLETHRHKGMDVVITCQSMHQLHKMAKVLIDNHRHFQRPHGGDTWRCYIYDEAKDNPTAATHLKTAIKTKGTFNKAYFDKYTSAQLHTYRDRFPVKYKIFLVSLIVLAICLITYTSILITDKETFLPDSQDDVETSEPSLEKKFSISDLQTNIPSRFNPEVNLAHLFTPRIENMPDSAPIYDDTWSDIKDYPRAQPIYFSSGPRKGLCRVYDQQGNRMPQVDHKTCMYLIEKGRTFDPRIEPARRSDFKNAPRVSEAAPNGALRTRAPRTLRPEPSRVTIVRSSGRPNFPNSGNSFSSGRE